MQKAKLEAAKKIVLKGSVPEKLELYGFDFQTPRKTIKQKFKFFAMGNFPRFFTKKSANFHDDMIDGMIKSYFGENWLIAAMRGSAKTSLAKLFICFVLLNDKDNYRKYIKVLSKDGKNSRQIVTDIYNLMVEVRPIYGNQFEKEGDVKREETMGSFTMKSGRKLSAGTVGQTQRGHIQDAYRPDFCVFDDLEDRDSITSMAITQSVIDKMEEAIDGLSLDGSYLVLCNYISDQGTIQHLMNKGSIHKLIIPLLTNEKDDNSTVWPEAFPPEKVAKLRADSYDFYGEMLCMPEKSQNKFFPLDRINEDLKNCREPKRTSAGVKYWEDYKPNHRYGMGSDHSEGVGLDSNTLCLFDFNTGEVVATYANNQIKPDLAVHEFARVGNEYGNCVFAPEVNASCGGIAITTLKHLEYPNIYKQIKDDKVATKHTDNLGWSTNSKTKYTMFHEFRTDYNDGLIKIYDKGLLMEMKAYSNNDLTETNTGLITRHFDLVTACFIKGTLILTEKGQKPIETIMIGDKVMTRSGLKKVIATSSMLKEVITNLGLTGTPDHPVFCNDNQTKNLSCINTGDMMYTWDSKAQRIERLSYTEVLNIIDIQIQKKGIIEYILVEVLNGRNQLFTCIERFGLIILEKFRMVLLYIIKMVIQPITTLKILKLCTDQHMPECTCLTQSLNKIKESGLNKTEKNSIKAGCDIIQMKKIKNNIFVIFVEKFLKVLLLMQNIVQNNVGGECKMPKKENLKKKKNVQYVEKNSKQVVPIKNIVQKNVLDLEEENTCQQVFNLQIEECPEYFANNILVHNCVIGWQMRKVAIQAKSDLKSYNENYQKYLKSLT